MIDLRAIREREKSATPGPWGNDCDESGGRQFVHNTRGSALFDSDEAEFADLEFAAHARQDVPALLDLVDELTGAMLFAEWGGDNNCNCNLGGVYTHVECPLDAALTRAGFPDQASRDAERVARERAKGYAASVRAMEARALDASEAERMRRAGG